MSLTYLGSLSLGAAVPLAATVDAAVVPKLQAEVTGILTAQAAITLNPPSISASLSLAQALVADITAAIALGVTEPSLSVQLAALAALLVAVQADLTVALSLQTALLSAGVHAYAYSGPASGLGPSLPDHFPGGLPGDAANALVLATTTPATWVSMQLLFRTTP
jgi:hypothetical protein